MKGKYYNWTFIVTLAAFVVAMGSTPALAEREQTFETSSGKKLTMNFKAGGSATVTGWDKDLIEVVYDDRHRDLDEYDFDFDEGRSGLKITAKLRNRDGTSDLHFEIRVPQEFDVEFRSAGGGLDILGVEGKFTGKTMGGHLTLRDAAGEVRLTTMGGRIEVVRCDLDGKIHTMGGRALVENVTGDLDVTSNGGNVEYRNVHRRDGDVGRPPQLRSGGDVSSSTVLIATAGGDVDVDDAPGGANVSTGGGDITVRGASRFVKARTGGGDIDIRVENGWVKATTGAGDIEVVIEKSAGEGDDPITLITGYGDIRLTVPRGFSMELDIDLGFTRKRDGDYGIITDFDIDEEKTTKWDYDNGSPRKHIYGTGAFAGGRHKIHIRNVNGNVYLKEGR